MHKIIKDYIAITFSKKAHAGNKQIHEEVKVMSQRLVNFEQSLKKHRETRVSKTHHCACIVLDR